MAASIYPHEPGSKYGPCEGNKACSHLDCAQQHRDATSLCRLCNKPIGYGNRVYQEHFSSISYHYVHADCLEDEIERQSTLPRDLAFTKPVELKRDDNITINAVGSTTEGVRINKKERSITFAFPEKVFDTMVNMGLQPLMYVEVRKLTPEQIREELAKFKREQGNE